MRRRVIIGALAVVVLAAVVVLVLSRSKAGQEERPTLSGSITTPAYRGQTHQNDETLIVDGSPCESIRGYDDIDDGATVEVRDGNGGVIATAHLDSGRAVDVDPSHFGRCEFRFTVPELPDAAFYAFTIGSRKGTTYSKQELLDKQWRVDLTLGS